MYKIDTTRTTYILPYHLLKSSTCHIGCMAQKGVRIPEMRVQYSFFQYDSHSDTAVKQEEGG